MATVVVSATARVVSINSGDYRERFLAKRNALVTAHLHLVPPIAHHVSLTLPPSFDYGDLLGAGYLGLLHAATKYRPKEHDGAPFSSYARPRIHGAIVDSVRRNKYTENTRPPLEAAPEPTTGPLDTRFDERRLKKRLLEAIASLPARPRDRNGKFQTIAAKLAEIHEWRAAADHVQAIAEMRRGLKRAA